MTEIKYDKNLTENVKTFKDLEKEVIGNGQCCGCGACIAYCESQSFNVIDMENNSPKFKSDKTVENCNECGVCYYICPQTPMIIENLNEFHSVEDELGHIIKILAAKTSKKEIEEVGQDGGIVTTILTYLFDEMKIDAAIISEYNINLEPIPKIIFNKEELLKSAGTRYSISPQILPLKDLYNLYQEILDKEGIHDVDNLRVAFVGTPCQCRAISKMKFLYVKPAHVIKYIISLFCFENFNYTQLYDILKRKTKVDSNQIKKTWIKKNFFIQTKDDKEFEIDIKTLDPAVRSNCHECNEFTGKFADISVGASGAPEGYSMVIIRNDIGENVINKMLSKGLIEQYIVPSYNTIEWKNKKLEWYKKLIAIKTKK